MNTVASEAESEYNGFEARLEKRFSRGLSFLASYTLSKSMDDASGSGGTADSGVPQNSHDVGAEWGPWCLTCVTASSSARSTNSRSARVGGG